MAKFITKKWIGNNEVDGTKILLENAQFVRAKKADGSTVSLFNLDANDVFNFQQVPVLASGAESSSPQALQTGGQVDSTVTTALAPVIADVATERGRITSEIAARTAADSALGVRVDDEAAARTAADSALGVRVDDVEQLVDDEVSARGGEITRVEGLITAEVSARTTADSALGGRIDTEAARITAEVSARTTADTALGGRIDGEALRITTEISDRTSEVTRLDGRIDTNEDRIDDEINDRTQADTALGLRIDGEAATRLAADNLLGGRIDTEITDRTAAVGAVDGRVTTEVTRLDGRIDDLAAQVSGDIDQRLDEETAARIAADSALGVRIDGVESDVSDEVAARIAAVSAVDGRVTTEAARLDGRVDGEAARIDSEILRLDGEISTRTSEITRVEGLVTAEASTRSAADLALNGRVDGVEDDLEAEVTARTSGDAANAAAIALQTGRIDGEITRLDGEILARTAADTALGARIDGVETGVSDEAARALAAEALLIPLAQKGAANGVVPLDGNTLIPLQYIPNSLVDVLEFADLASFPATGMGGTIYVDMATNRTYRWSGSVYSEVSPSAVTSVNGKADAVVLDTSDIAEGINKYYTDQRVQDLLADQFEDIAETAGDHETRIAYLEQFPKPVWDNFKRTLTGADITANGFVLPFDALANSMIVSIDRLMMYEGEDFVVNNDNGVKTLVFMGDLAVGGPQSVVEGDNIYIKYQREYTEPV